MDNKKVVPILALLVLGMLVMVPGLIQAQTKAPAKAAESARIDLNKTTAEQLAKCPGLSAPLSRAIVEYREKSGPFKKPDDLLKVKGMTKDILSKEPRPQGGALKPLKQF